MRWNQLRSVLRCFPNADHGEHRWNQRDLAEKNLFGQSKERQQKQCSERGAENEREQAARGSSTKTHDEGSLVRLFIRSEIGKFIDPEKCGDEQTERNRNQQRDDVDLAAPNQIRADANQRTVNKSPPPIRRIRGRTV